MEVWLHSLLFLISSSVCTAYRWSASSPADGTTFYACVGDTATFSWDYSLENNEVIYSLQWYFERSGRNSEIIATIIDRQFIVSSPTRQYLKFVSSAGLRLDLVSQDDFGKYYVRLDTVHNETLHSETRWVALLPPEAPNIKYQTLTARILPTATLVAGTWHGQLACGFFYAVGTAFTVVWKSPSNRIYNSNSYEDGEFLLTLNSPVEEGTYTCHLHNIDHTARCLEISSTLDFGGEVYVNADAVQYTISQTNCSQPQRLQDMTSAWELLMNHSSSGTIRLVNGDRPWKGRVEVFQNLIWGTVCDDNFTVSAAAVVCRMLGINVVTPAVHEASFYGQGSLPILLDDVICSGNESSLSECRHNPVGENDCNHQEDVGVDCIPSLTMT
ncbi:uncharacterized protein LOC112569537 [Pomacea canaliculata]|uniref:uncharacterized protein LOC112569537 n=1 Tax=Pomacea canaliculata TaxID=400727 RepID=UPI000D72ABC0|nr:uncharacterized protein LOC112569537 [Pomacea canaliculata]